MPHIHLKRSLYDSILDVGGGGEGVIGRLYGDQVIAIDRLKAELDEAPGGFEKRVMDATALDFPDGRFHNVTFFYTLMYMPCDVKRRALREAARVLRHGGRLLVWDAAFESAWPEPFVVHLDISGPGVALHADYGVCGEALAQDMGLIAGYSREAGLALTGRDEFEGQFRAVFIKM